jgi:ankyrin repeat protein
VELLLRAGADKDAQSHDGMTPLHSAALSGHKECVQLLLRADATSTLRTVLRGTGFWSPGGVTARQVAGSREIASLLARAELTAQLAPLAAAAARGELFDARFFDAALWRVVARFALEPFLAQLP